jgi:hypothetical protein
VHVRLAKTSITLQIPPWVHVRRPDELQTDHEPDDPFTALKKGEKRKAEDTNAWYHYHCQEMEKHLRNLTSILTVAK